MKKRGISLPKIVALDKVDSTSDYLIRNLDNYPSDTLVWALDQTKGRGASGNWLSKREEGLTFSFSLRDLHFSPQNIFFFNILVSNHLSAKISQLTDIPTQVKWPNDIYLRSKKIAGVLIETALHKGQVMDLVIGIGVNVNQEKFPSHMLEKATSMYLETEERRCLPDVANFMMTSIYLYVKRGLHAFRVEEELKRYNLNLYARGVKRKFRGFETNEEFEGVILGVDAAGKLKVQITYTGSITRYSNKEIVML